MPFLPRGLLAPVASMVLLSVGCRDEAETASEDMSAPDDDTSDADDETSGSSGEGDSARGQGSESCLSAPSLTPGAYSGFLGGRPDGGAGACGQGGPAVFFRIDLDHRSDVSVSAVGEGFEPRVGVFDNDCGLAFDDAGLLCTAGVPGWVSDVPAGSTLFVAVGGDPAAIEASQDGAFRLDVETRPILVAGETCGLEAWGRCEGGTTCVLGEETSGVCTPIPGDRCGNALDLSLDPGTTVLTIDAEAIHTDAHAHSCGGARMPERVYRVQLPSLSDDATLTLEGERVVALAARAPGCLEAEETACAHEPMGLPVATLQGPLPEVLYLFVELSDEPTSELSPGIVRLRLEDG